MRIVFFGTSLFAAHILSFLFKHSYNIIAIVTQPDRPRGRHLHSSFSPVKEIALAKEPKSILLQPDKISTPEYAELLKSFNPDLFLVVAYGEIIKKDLLAIPRLGPFNIHASLLPKYRGAAPIQRCLMNGEEKTGINIIEMTPQMDAGDIVAASEIAISEDMTFGELEMQLCQLACDLLPSFLMQAAEETLQRVPQDQQQVTFAPKLQAADERIDWNASAHSLHNLIRALSPTPGAWCLISLGKEQKRIKIKRARPLLRAHSAEPGFLLPAQKGELLVACGQGALQLIEVQVEGKKTLPVGDFLKGAQQLLRFV
ncbi:MAG TPA: methionyl-tRNA formyltransferase [Rhabdochlamydiaceae bacterium]|jgi:methionyl-tRNA formyltransferase